MPPTERLREHPENRLASPVQIIDLDAVARELRAEAHEPVAGHRQIAIVRQGPVTLILFAFDAAGWLKEHRTEGVVAIQVLKGRMVVIVEDEERSVGPGELVTLAPGVLHSLHALVASEMLLAVHRVPAEGAAG